MSGDSKLSGLLPARLPARQTVWRLVELSAVIVTIVGYLLGPLVPTIPGPWNIVVILAGFVVVLTGCIAGAWHVANGFSYQTQALIEKQLSDNREQVARAFRKELASVRSAERDAATRQSALSLLANINYQLKKIPSVIRNSPKPEQEALQYLHESLRDLAAVYMGISGHECRFSIKVIYESADKFPGSKGRAAITLARSETPHQDQPRPGPDTLDANTVFAEILAGAPSWTSNNIQKLRKDGRYSNTSPTTPYNSAITWGIRSHADGSGELYGFLCLDSVDTNAFKMPMDRDLGWFYVDVLWGVLDQLSTFTDIHPNAKLREKNTEAT